MVVMSLPDGSPDCPADCPRLDFPVNEMPSGLEIRNRCWRWLGERLTLDENTRVTDHAGVTSRTKACHIAWSDSSSTLSTIASRLGFILDSESRQILTILFPTYPPLTIGRVGPLGTGFIRLHPHRPFALETIRLILRAISIPQIYYHG